MQEMNNPDGFEVFVQNKYQEYTEEQLSMPGAKIHHILPLDRYRTEYHSWLVTQYEESQNG